MSSVADDPKPFQLKTFFSPDLVRRLAKDISNAYPGFPSARFTREACAGLDALELLDRGRHIGRVLAKHLPPSYPEAVEILMRSLGPEHASDELIGAGMEPFFYFPHTVFVAEHGLDHFEASMHAQCELTKRFSAESSIRPFLAKYPERTYRQFEQWARDTNPHVRRLVSEGSRLRLPWAPRVEWLDDNPDKVIALLEMLKDDRASLVRRSVANNLNDLGKVYPDLLIQTCDAWLKNASNHRRALIEHALRSAIKRGEPAALKMLGFGGKAAVTIERVSISPKRVAIGGRVRVEFTLRSRSRQAQELLVDLAVHFVKAGGRTSKKVFKLKRVSLAPKATAAFSTSVSLAVHTTRKPQPGRHIVEAVVNGKTMPLGHFDVV